MNRPSFPSVVDSTIIAAWRSCQRKAELEYLLHFKPRGLSVHLHAGAAYAKGLEVARKAFFLQGLSAGESVAQGLGALLAAYGDFECPEDSPKSAARMAGALEYYFDQYPLERDKAIPVTLPDGNKGIEFSFAEPTDVLHPETGDPILYSGRADMICEYAASQYGLDDKTTSQLGASWARQWDLRSQFTGYTWLAQKAGFPVQGFLIRGISILKSKYETQQAITYRPEWMISRWYKELCVNIEEMIVAWRTGDFRYDLDHACVEYGGCPFRKVCLSEDPTPWLAAEFERRVWDPVGRTETTL